MNKYEENFQTYLDKKAEKINLEIDSLDERQEFINYLSQNYKISGYKEKSKQALIDILNKLDMCRKMLMLYLKTETGYLWTECVNIVEV